jgi:hypothetical protein
MESVLLGISVGGFILLYLEIRELRAKLNRLLERPENR